MLAMLIVNVKKTAEITFDPKLIDDYSPAIINIFLATAEA